MLQQRRRRSQFDVGLGLAVALAGLAVASTFMACSFTPVLSEPGDLHEVLNNAPEKDLTHTQRATYVNVPGYLNVQHGVGCAEADKGADNDSIGLRIRDKAVIPQGYNSGTVFLNGWRLAYRNGDHHVQGLGSAVFNITQTEIDRQLELHWEAGGGISDWNGDDPFDWCYIYTLLFWFRNPSDVTVTPEIAAWPMHSDANPEELTFMHTTDVDAGNATARRELPGAVKASDPRAILPRGFALAWTDYPDHSILQKGFDLGRPVPSGNTISWTSATLLKDNSDRYDYRGSEIVSVLSGPSANVLHPDTVLRLRSGSWTPVSNTVPLTPNTDPESTPPCVGGDPETHQAQFKIENVPFDFAIPVLTGWELFYPCTDHHVERIGAWIKGFGYDAQRRTLTYTIESTLADDAVSGTNGGEAHYKVSVLGLNRAGLLPPVPTGSKGTSAVLAAPALQLP